MTRPVLVLTHAPQEGPGLIASELDHPLRVRTVLTEAAPNLPGPEDIAGLIVMGGSMDADDAEHYPGLLAEQRLLADATSAGVPVLGVCLGAQLLGLALGGHLVRRGGTEVGFGPIEVLTDDPLLAPLGASPEVLHWHQDQIAPPSEATILARSAITPVQAFRLGSAVGLQFHIEVDMAMLDLWLGMTDDLLDPEQIEDMRADGRRVLPGLVPAARLALAEFGAQVRARG